MEEIERYANRIYQLHESFIRPKDMSSWTLYHTPVHSFKKLDSTLAPCHGEQPKREFPDTPFTFGLFRLIISHKIKNQPLDYRWLLTLVEEYANKFYKQNFHRIRLTKRMAIHLNGKPLKGWNNVDDYYKAMRKFVANRFTFHVFKMNVIKRMNQHTNPNILF